VQNRAALDQGDGQECGEREGDGTHWQGLRGTTTVPASRICVSWRVWFGCVCRGLLRIPGGILSGRQARTPVKVLPRHGFARAGRSPDMALRSTSAARHSDGWNTQPRAHEGGRVYGLLVARRINGSPGAAEPLPLSWSARRPTRRAVVVVVFEPRPVSGAPTGQCNRAQGCDLERRPPAGSAMPLDWGPRTRRFVQGNAAPSPHHRTRSRPIVRPVSDAPTGQWNGAQGCGVRAATLGWASHPPPPTPTGLRP
jgi:hypothetical protein